MRKRSLPQPEERTERRISAATSLSICALTVIAQIVLTLALTQLLAEKISYVYFILELAGAVVAIWVYLRPGSPSYKLVWMCLLLALPVAGMILFLLWGGSHQAKSLSLRKVAPPVEREGARQASAANVAHLSRRSPAWGRLASYLQSRDFLLYGGSQARYFAEGADFFDDLVLHLQRAEIYIFLEYYILAEGQIWDRIFHVLRERAAAGVEVRIIFDDFGNLTRFSDASLQALQDAGVEPQVCDAAVRAVDARADRREQPRERRSVEVLRAEVRQRVLQRLQQPRHGLLQRREPLLDGFVAGALRQGKLQRGIVRHASSSPPPCCDMSARSTAIARTRNCGSGAPSAPAFSTTLPSSVSKYHAVTSGHSSTS